MRESTKFNGKRNVNRLRVIGYGELRIPVIENGKDDAASKSPRITQGKEKNRAEMRLPKFGRCMAAQKAVPESNSGAMNEEGAAEYRLKQDTAALTRRNSGEH